MPAQVIELAYLSALLEQQRGSSLLSHKLDIVRRFLENVVQVVPFESIAYALTNGNSHTTLQCIRALKIPNVKIPQSLLMYHGLRDAEYQLEYGVPLQLIYSMNFEAGKQLISRSMNDISTREGMYTESGKLIFELNEYLPGTAIPLREPIRIVTDMSSFKSRTLFSKQIVDDVKLLRQTICDVHRVSDNHFERLEVVSRANIEDLYSISSESSSGLKSPLDVLVTGRKQLTELSEKLLSKSCSNQEMLHTVNTIRHHELDTCTSLLGGFMHQGFVQIYLSSPKNPRFSEVSLRATASVGVWALFSLDYHQIQPILLKCQGKQLLVKLFDHVKGISGISQESDETAFNPYAAKLQFITQGMTKTVTMSGNADNVSYSLERQLVELCNERNINATVPLSDITGKWSVLFKENILSLVHIKCRLLVARWLKWALMIHNLREELAKYTAVGVVGLVNSGKSKLVNTLFGIRVLHYKHETCDFYINAL